MVKSQTLCSEKLPLLQENLPSCQWTWCSVCNLCVIMFKQVLEDVIILPTMDDHWQLFRFSKIQSEIEKLNLFIGYLLVTDHDHIQPRYNPLFQLYGFKTGEIVYGDRRLRRPCKGVGGGGQCPRPKIVTYRPKITLFLIDFYILLRRFIYQLLS